MKRIKDRELTDEHQTKKYEIVSLGQNCLPRTILTRWGIKPRKAQGELSCPFDLVRHKLERIIYYLEQDFKGYFDDFFFVLRKRNFLDFRGRGLWQKKDGTIFYHDKDCKINDKEKIVQRVSGRIENFRKILKADTPILFVLNIMNSTQENNLEENLARLCKVIKKIRGDKYFKIAVIDFEYMVKDSDDYYVLRLPKPVENYENDWNKSSVAKSARGLYCENCICQFVKYIIDKDFNF